MVFLSSCWVIVLALYAFIAKVMNYRSEYSLYIYTVMNIEAGILYGNEGILQSLGNLTMVAQIRFSYP